jgi:hypothetical protein
MKTTRILKATFSSGNSDATHTLPQTTKIPKPPPDGAVFDYSKRSEIRAQIEKLSPLYLGHFDKAHTGKSLRSAITAKCLDCQGWERTGVRDCEDGSCPLWLNRPYKDKESQDSYPGLEEDRLENLQMVESWSPVYLGRFKKAYAGKSLRAAVNGMCLDCTCCQKEEVKHCPATQCSLWEYRPYQVKSQEEGNMTDKLPNIYDAEGGEQNG